MDELRLAFTAAKRGANPFAILYIDIDHFKDINDVLGHSKGDALLKLVARRLQNTIRDGDSIARFGGDEFAILQHSINDASDAGALAARVLREVAEPPYDIGTQVDVTASIGIAYFGPEITDAEELIKNADMALYRAKDSGRNQFHFHSEALDTAIIERVTLAGDLRLGLERNEFELYYQPQVDVRTGQIFGIEALARWHHPKQGLLHPGHFIPIAEKTGAILPLGRWVIEGVCQQIATWRTEGLVPPKVALNVSAIQMKSPADFERDLLHTLQSWNLAPSDIELELTESVLMATTREHRQLIERLNVLGIAIAIDDFGTGYSSLGYLRAYRVSHIKIAQDFIQNVEEGSGDVAIIRAAISLGRELGISVIAEGVETDYQLRLLMQAGCPLVQGFYFSAPVPAARMGALLSQKRPFKPATPSLNKAR
jgi:diguanylate cyclase (GGDEF)-like protein